MNKPNPFSPCGESTFSKVEGLVTQQPLFRPPSPMRLSRDKQRSPSGDFAEDSVRSADNSRNPLQPEPPDITAANAVSKEQGGPGVASYLCHPRTLFGTFSRERKYESNTEDKQQKVVHFSNVTGTCFSRGLPPSSPCGESTSLPEGGFPVFLCGCACCFSNPCGFSKGASFIALRREGCQPGSGLRRGGASAAPIQHLLPAFAFGEVPTGDPLPANAP